MGRKRVEQFDLDTIPPPASPEALVIAKQISNWSQAARKRAERKKDGTAPRGMNTAMMKRAAEELDGMMKSNDWAKARPKHFVAFYARCHLMVYGVEALELGPTERLHAAAKAALMLKKHFENDASAMADYCAWVWSRERAKLRRQHPVRRVHWRLMFDPVLLTDYHMDIVQNSRKSANH